MQEKIQKCEHHNHSLDKTWKKNSLIFRNWFVTHLAEPTALFAEECGFGNATRVHTGEDNSSILVVTTMKFRNGHHVADLSRKVKSKIIWEKAT